LVKTSYNADVIVLSGTIPEFHTPEECYDAGASAAIKKPAKLVDILETVKSMMNKRRSSIIDNLWEMMVNKAQLCDEASKKYLPESCIKLLLIGESPPSKPSYFYIPDNLSRKAGSFPAKVFRGLRGDVAGVDKEMCRELLRCFQENNFFVTDLCQYPLDNFVNQFRLGIIRDQLDDFEKRLSNLQLDENCTKLIVLPGGTHKELYNKFRDVRERLNQLGFDDNSIILWSKLEGRLRHFSDTNLWLSDCR
jgi:hypothetical protein